MNSSTIQLLDLDPNFSDEKLEELFGDFGPIKRCFVIKPKKNQAKTRGIIQFGISDDVDKLFEDTNGQLKIDDENSLRFKRIADEKQQNPEKDLAQKEFDRKVAKEKKARLIVRNLSFKATEENMKGHFGKLGKVVDVNILKKKDGKMVGCAFVQYSNVAEAAKAIKELNGNNFLNRPIALDWAVSKERFQSQAPIKEEPIDDTEIKHAYAAELVDLNGDGKKQLLANNWEKKGNGVWAYTVPDDLINGTFEKFTIATDFDISWKYALFTIGGPGYHYIFYPDLEDKSGRAHILLCGHGDQRAYLLTPTGDSEKFEYERHEIKNFGAVLGGMALSDFDGDGHPEVWMAAYEKGYIEAFKTSPDSQEFFQEWSSGYTFLQ